MKNRQATLELAIKASKLDLQLKLTIPALVLLTVVNLYHQYLYF